MTDRIIIASREDLSCALDAAWAIRAWKRISEEDALKEIRRFLPQRYPHLTRQTVWAWRRGHHRMPVEILPAIARTVGATPAELVELGRHSPDHPGSVEQSWYAWNRRVAAAARALAARRSPVRD